MRVTRRNNRRGSAMVEMALMLPLVLMMCMGAVDFGRLFYHAVTTINAAGTGAHYGSHDNIIAGDLAGIEQRAADDAKDVTGATVSASQLCGCPTSSGGFAKVDCVDLATTSCAGYGVPRAYVLVNVGEKFQTVGTYPGIPPTTPVGHWAYMRVR